MREAGMRPGLRRRRITLTLAILSGWGVAAADPAPAPVSSPAAIAAGLRTLHQGLYARAEETFRAAAVAAPDDPEPQFFIAFDRWWRSLLEERGRRDDDAAFDAAIDATLRLAEARLAASPDDARSLAVAGAARILRSHVEAMRHNYFRAAQEARRGKRVLEQALARDPSANAALFALGAFNYFADKVPAVVKGLRALLFLPGGDAELGLAQLSAVAASSGPFRTDASLLLAIVRGSREESCYGQSLLGLQRILAENPGSPLILGSIGELQMRLGRYPEAVSTFEEALRSASGEEADRQRQRRFLRVALAEALVGAWCLDRAEEILSHAVTDPGALSDAAHRARDRAAAELADKRAQLPAAALRALETGDRAGAMVALDQAVAASPENGAALFLRGHLWLQQGRLPEAQSDLETAERMTADPPPWMEGWSEIDQGLIARQSGRERSARSHLHKASDLKHFRSNDRAVLELGPAVTPGPACGS